MPDHDHAESYERYQHDQFREWEARCRQCGACCGVMDGDPCEHLRRRDDDRYYCSIYDHRFGLHQTVGGKIFRCVPVREILHRSWPGAWSCAYKSPDP